MDVEIPFPIWIKVYGADHKTLAITLAAEIIALLVILYFQTKYQQTIKKEQL